MLGDEVWRARFAVPHHKHIGLHGGKIVDCVKQGLALTGRGGGNIQVHDIGRKPLGRNFKRGAGARGVFKKQVKHAFARHERAFFHIPHKGSCGIENLINNGGWQAFRGQQVLKFAVLIQLRIIHSA